MEQPAEGGVSTAVAFSALRLIHIYRLSLTNGFPVQCVEDELCRLVVSEVDESVASHDASVPVADKLDFQLLSCSKRKNSVQKNDDEHQIQRGPGGWRGRAAAGKKSLHVHSCQTCFRHPAGHHEDSPMLLNRPSTYSSVHSGC